MSRMITIHRICCCFLLILFMAAPVLGRLGIEAGPGMEIYGIKGKRLPMASALDCDWKDSGLVVGYGEQCCIEVTANDVDMYYDPIPVPGAPMGLWTVYGPDGQPLEYAQNVLPQSLMHNDPSGTWYFTTDLIFLPRSPGTYKAECLVVDYVSSLMTL